MPGCAPSSPRSSATWHSRAVVGLLRPASGRLAVSGISVVSGPVDGYLALALAVVGEREEATALAERAEALATRWGMMAYLRWFAERAPTGVLAACCAAGQAVGPLAHASCSRTRCGLTTACSWSRSGPASGSGPGATVAVAEGPRLGPLEAATHEGVQHPVRRAGEGEHRLRGRRRAGPPGPSRR